MFETSWDFPLAERVAVDFTEDWSKLLCTERQCVCGGGGYGLGPLLSCDLHFTVFFSYVKGEKLKLNKVW